MAVDLVHGRRPGDEPTYLAEVRELTRVLLVAGLSVGIVVIGLGSRIAMFLLRLTSPETVDGVVSDDGFEIGQVTLAGTYNLLTIGAAVGFIGAVAYVLVAPWLVGPTWLGRATVGITAGAMGGAMLLHADGVDFTSTGPLWFAVTLFIVLPLLSGVAIAAATDAVAAPGSWTSRGRWRWALPLALVLLVPRTLVVVVVLCAVVAGLLLLRRLLLRRIQASPVATFGVRAMFLAVPVLSFVALGQDLVELY
ncbi:hypothetical protein ACT8ZV_10985 [Nocardioides sp. MAHUQ-72]|uniref:hypothetical protein n=1 Tax=unclassified Nocardioides TaxID=2615069 RepID=UPI003609147F